MLSAVFTEVLGIHPFCNFAFTSTFNYNSEVPSNKTSAAKKPFVLSANYQLL